MSDNFYDDYISGDDEFDPTRARQRAEEMLKRITDDGRLPEMLFRQQLLTHIVKDIREMFGNDGIFELMCAIDFLTGVSTEIIAERADVENILLDKYGAFDDEIWEKVQNTLAWTELHRAIFLASKLWLERAVDEVVKGH